MEKSNKEGNKTNQLFHNQKDNYKKELMMIKTI